MLFQKQQDWQTMFHVSSRNHIMIEPGTARRAFRWNEYALR